MGPRLNYSGLVVAGVGFFLTRFTVVLALDVDPLRFYLGGIVPLALGLGLAAFGVGLTVADLDPSYVRTTAVWCVVGAATMLLLVVLTLLGSAPDAMADLQTVRSRTYLSNFLIGGSIGGTLTGLYAARNRRQREALRQNASRLSVLNRLLRHEVLNSVAVIKGYVGADAEEAPAADAIIAEHATVIEETIDDVKHLTRDPQTTGPERTPVDLSSHLDDAVAAVQQRHPDADVTVEAPGEATVLADERLSAVFEQLLENAIQHADTTPPSAAITVSTTARTVRVGVVDGGPGLPDRQRRLLEDGEIGEFDDPESGFGLNLVRLLVESYGGSVETAVGPDGSTITVVLGQPSGDDPLRNDGAGFGGIRPSAPHLVVALAAALLAGVAYGLVAEASGGSVAFIGVYYGVQSPVVGWLTHEFHSVVFGFAYAGLLSLVPAETRRRTWTYVGVGAGWGAVLWFLAAGFVSPIWLRLLGEPRPVPTLSPWLLVTHLVWGVSLGLLTAAGYAYAVPWLRGVGERLQSDDS
jgi:two-component system OmpR family sensor kinase